MKKLVEDYISESGIIIPKDGVEYIKSGGNSYIWKYSKDGKDYAFKEFIEDRQYYSLGYDTYQKMHEMDLQNVIKPLEAYKRISNTSEKCIDAYLMEYIMSDPDFSSMDYPIDKLIESIIGLEKDIETLSKAHIIMHDVGALNTIVGRDDHKLNVIDIDMYYYDKYTPVADAYKQNRDQLFNLIRFVLFRGLIYCEEFDPVRQEIKDWLAESFAKENPEELSVVTQKLFGSYETPRAFLRERKF